MLKYSIYIIGLFSTRSYLKQRNCKPKEFNLAFTLNAIHFLNPFKLVNVLNFFHKMPQYRRYKDFFLAYRIYR